MPLKSPFQQPNFFRIVPPLLAEFGKDELIWFNLAQMPTFKPIFENNDVTGNDKVLKICADSFKQTVSISDLKYLIDSLNPKLIDRMGVTPQNISSIIEFNPFFAYKILLNLLKSDHSTDYLTALVNMEMSLNSLEVVNHLISSIELPSEFLQLYISNCINACEKITDKFYQSRSVRIFCVFLQSLIRKKKIETKNLSFEIESFCITFNRIKECTDLYKLSKSI